MRIADESEDFTILTEPGTILEATLAQYNLSVNDCRIHYSIEFLGPLVTNDHAFISHGNVYSSIRVKTIHQVVKTNPSASLDIYSTHYYPSKFKLGPLKQDRDLTVNDNQIYCLEMEYNWKQEVSCKVTPSFPVIADLLYESPFGGNFYMIYDSNKKVVLSGDAFAETEKLEKGENYTMKIQLRHSSTDILEKFKSLSLRLDHTLAKPITAGIALSQRMLINDNKGGNIKKTMGQFCYFCTFFFVGLLFLLVSCLLVSCFILSVYVVA